MNHRPLLPGTRRVSVARFAASFERESARLAQLSLTVVVIVRVIVMALTTLVAVFVLVLMFVPFA